MLRVALRFGSALPMIAALLTAQQSGFIAGTVRDRSGSVIPDSVVQVQNEWTGARMKILSDAQGRYETGALASGAYKVTVRKQGFRTVTESGVVVAVGKTWLVDFELDVLPLQQEVTVNGTPHDINPASEGLSLGRRSSAATLPANGRDLHALFALMPGAVVTPASIGDGGQFTVTGQRPNTNSFRVDGISANTGVGASAVPGSFPGSTLPGMTAIGSTHNLASKEETDSVELRSSDFTVQFGERPGAQIAVETRSGSDEFHGSLFGYTRPPVWDGDDWFAHSCEKLLPKRSLDGFGASLGGPVIRDRTFFFGSFERSVVDDSALQLISVPSLSARAMAPARYRPILDSFPRPNGCHLDVNETVGTLAMHKTASVSNYSFRIDQSLGSKAKLFFRSAEVPSSAKTSELGTSRTVFNWRSVTLGFSIAQRSDLNHEIRLNFSRADANAEWGSATDPDQSAIELITTSLPSAPVGSRRITSVSIAGVGQFVSGQAGRSFQNQWEASYSVSKTIGRHEIRAGGDYVRLSPRRDKPIETVSVVSQSVESLLSQAPLDVTVSSVWPESANVKITSLFAQDTFKANSRFSLLYGLRWELTPPVAAQQVTFPYVGFWSGTGTQPRWIGSVDNVARSAWPMRYSQFAPRAGLAYHLKRTDFVLRAGAGLFYDSGLGSAIDRVYGAPLNSWQFSSDANSNGLLLRTQAAASGAAVNIPPLRLPVVLEWRTSVEKSVGAKTLVSVSYIGSAGRSLLRQQAQVSPQTQILQSLDLTSYGVSNYEALQAQFTGNISPNLFVLLAYTWGHSIDNGSQGSSLFLAPPGYDGRRDRASSSFDVRHSSSSSLSYRLSPAAVSPLCRSVLGNWNISSTVQVRTGFPIDIASVDKSLGLGFDNAGRPDLVLGLPIWVANSLAPGGRQLNPAAFLAAHDGTQGTLGRNAVTGNGLFQIDASLHRQFALFGTSSLEVSISGFNVLNHPPLPTPCAIS
jgi:hypothetical protein